jgi:hypothetical protein
LVACVEPENPKFFKASLRFARAFLF